MIPGWVEQYIGLPFEVFNCWQLYKKIYQEQLGVTLPYLDDRYIDAMDKENIHNIYDVELQNDWLKLPGPAMWAAAVFKVQGVLWHVGLVIDDDTMIHTHANIDSMLERFTNSIWRNRLEGFYSYVG